MVGAGVAVIRSLVQRKSPWKPAAPGFVGGSLTSVVKQVAVTGRGSNGVWGRTIAGLGNSLDVSGQGYCPAIATKLGPLEIGARRDDEAWHPLTRANVAQLATLAYYYQRSGITWDVHNLPKTGNPVLRSKVNWLTGNRDVKGLEMFGAVIVTSPKAVFDRPKYRSEVLGHEAVNVIQENQFNTLIALPLERKLMQRAAGWRAMSQGIDLGVIGLGFDVLAQHVYSMTRAIWEQEAYRLTTSPT